LKQRFICARTPITKLRSPPQQRWSQPKMVNKCAHELSVTESVCVDLVQATLTAIRLVYLGGLHYKKVRTASEAPSSPPGVQVRSSHSGRNASGMSGNE
jgi:hypothetical protein